jgi:hypothetical protein
MAALALARHHCDLENKNHGACNTNGKQRLRDAGGQRLVCHVHAPMAELLERFQIAPRANARQTGCLIDR